MVLLAVALGVIVGLSASLISLAFLRSRQDYSTEVLDRALRLMDSAKGEEARQQTMQQISDRLDFLGGNVAAMHRTTRTVLERPMQVGEVPPGAPSRKMVHEPDPDPGLVLEDGLVDPPKASQTAARAVRERAFAAPT